MTEPTIVDLHRAVLSSVASVRAAQEQMQKDIDQLRAASNALIVMAVYSIAVGALLWALIRKGLPAA